MPAAIATTFFIYRSYQREYANVGRTTIDTARALMQTVDRELSSSEGVLQALATSPYLASGDLAAFYDQAQATLNHRDGNNFMLSDASGQQLINTYRPFGTALPRHANPNQLRRVFDSGESSISDLYIGGVTRRPIISIDFPVWRGNKVVYDLSMGFSPDRLGEILKRQRLPADWLAGILDSNGVIVARTHDAERFVGQKGSGVLMKRMLEASEGSFESISLDGVPVISAFSRSAVSNWTVGIGVPRATLTRELWKSISFIIGGAILFLAAGLVLAKMIGDKITRSVRDLVAPAMALGHGRPVVLPPLSFREAESVGQALVKASALLQKRTVERDQAEQAELEMRNRLGIEEKLKHSEERFRNAFDFAPVGMAFIGLDNCFIRVNDALCTLLGYTQTMLLGADQLDFSMREDLTHEQACLQRVLNAQSESAQFEKHYRTKEGKDICTLVSVSLLREDEKPACFLFQIHNVTERDMLRHLSAYQEQIKEEERKRIAREIHDELGSLLTGIKAYLSVEINRAEQSQSVPNPQLVDASIQADAAIETMRRVITDLRPSVLDELGLWAALEWYTEQMEKRTGLICKCMIDASAADIVVRDERSTMLFRIAQEALTNVVRHAQATSVILRALRQGSNIILEIKDNGRGIGGERLLDRESWGITGMHERARYFGGTLKIIGLPEQGTLVRLIMPLENEENVHNALSSLR